MEAHSIEDPHALLGGRNKKRILEVASKLLTNNNGQKRPFKVALDQLMAVLIRNAKDYSKANGEEIEAPSAEFIGEIRSQSMRAIVSSPEILCTLAMCDLSVPSSRNLVMSIKGEWDRSHGDPIDFHSLTVQFAAQSLQGKGENDSSREYWQDIEFVAHNDEEGFKSIGKVVQSVCFANHVTFIAYRYFLRYLWYSAAGVPKSWSAKGPFGLYQWIEETSKKKNRGLSLLQFRDEMLKPSIEKKRVDMGKGTDKPFYKGGFVSGSTVRILARPRGIQDQGKSTEGRKHAPKVHTGQKAESTGLVKEPDGGKAASMATVKGSSGGTAKDRAPEKNWASVAKSVAVGATAPVTEQNKSCTPAEKGTVRYTILKKDPVEGCPNDIRPTSWADATDD